jgi:hypothetical protein
MHKLLLLGVESAENPHSGSMNTVSTKKPFASKEKTPVVWYSHEYTPAIHHSRCTSTANKIASLVLCKSFRTQFHHFTPSHPPLPEKTPKSMADKGKKPLEENSFPSKKRTIRDNLLFSFLSLDFDCNLVIHLSLTAAGGHLWY